MWSGKSSSVSGICTVVDMRLRIQRLQRKSDKAAENAVRVWSPRSPCPQQTQMFQPDPDVLTFELAGVWMKGLNPDPMLFIPRMSRYYDSDEDITERQTGKKQFSLRSPDAIVCLQEQRELRSPRSQVCELVCVCRWRDTSKKDRASSFLVVQTHSHKSVTGQFLTHLRQHRLDLSLPLKDKRPSV